MVSIRRRRLLGLCSGKYSIPFGLPEPIESKNSLENGYKNVRHFSILPIPSAPSIHDKPENFSESSCGPPTMSASRLSKLDTNNYFPGKEIKRRRRHRRKYYEDQEPCIMRGVYFKNMKWQAAIKVEKKQIHLGTVGSQEEAARLYDRAAFLCGREPNFELSEEEKQELRQYKWEEFLAITRNAITNKKHQRKIGIGRRKRSGIETQGSDMEPEKSAGGFSSMSDDDMEAAAM